MLAWVDSAQDTASTLTYRIAIASLVVAIASLLFAGITYFGGPTWLD